MRCFPTAVGPLRFAVAPKLWDRLRLTAGAFDVVDVHTRSASLALAVARARVDRLVFTLGAPTDAFLGWPYARATRAFIGSTAQIVCHAEVERDLLCRSSMPTGSSQRVLISDGVDPRRCAPPSRS